MDSIEKVVRTVLEAPDTPDISPPRISAFEMHSKTDETLISPNDVETSPTTPLSRPASQLGTPTHAWAIAITGLVTLAVAMGIGRFAFTPLMPMMLREQLLDLSSASWLASINYLGYLTGGILCVMQPWFAMLLRRRKPLDASAIVRFGLVLTSLLTLGMAIHLPTIWPVLRFASGMASAIVLIFSSGWCLARLEQLNAGSLGGVMYAGPGAGIVISGLFTGGVAFAGWSASTGWSILGLLALLLTTLIWRTYGLPAIVTSRHGPAPAPAAGALASTTASTSMTSVHNRIEMSLLVAAYGLAGFGYIITATFLPVIARQALPGSVWIDLFWPLFGAAVMIGSLLASRLPRVGDWRLRLIFAYLMQATGVLVSLVWPSLPGFILGSVLLGLPFTAITFFAMQEVRRLRPRSVASGIGLSTVSYGIGQVVGPLLVATLLRRSHGTGQGFSWSLSVAVAALLLGAAIYGVSMRKYPLNTPVLATPT